MAKKKRKLPPTPKKADVSEIGMVYLARRTPEKLDELIRFMRKNG